MCDFVCGTMSHAKSLVHWSVIPQDLILLLNPKTENLIMSLRNDIVSFWF